MVEVVVVGGGLAGSECAWRLARAGHEVRVLDMKPGRMSPAHSSPRLGELVCSNSLRSEEPTMAVGVLKEEMRKLGSLVMAAAEATRIPAGKALAVDREDFAAFIGGSLEADPRVEVVKDVHVTSLDDPALAGAGLVVVAAGPLVSRELAEDLKARLGGELYFHDAIAPIVDAASLDMDLAFHGSRYRPEETDYINCPLTEQEYRALVAELAAAEQVPAREFERDLHFEGCLPVEEMARRGEMTLAFGPLKPVGLVDPATGERPFAVVQLRAENRDKTAYNLVGFQTRLRYGEQKRVFSMIPALAGAEFLRLGSVHRNTYVDAPRVLTGVGELQSRPGVFLAGQITGVEGYLESAASGLWTGLHLASRLFGEPVSRPPAESVLGGLLRHLTTEVKNYQPSNANFGLLPQLGVRAGKRRRKELYAQRAREAFGGWLEGLTGAVGPIP
jgi:methylenetetrahydrofolate--tRNA-(uracil-5-)-methyltransferase